MGSSLFPIPDSVALLQKKNQDPGVALPCGAASESFPRTKPSSFNQNQSGNICSRHRPAAPGPLLRISDVTRKQRESAGSCRGDASDAGERSAAPLPPALPGERRGPSPAALSPGTCHGPPCHGVLLPRAPGDPRGCEDVDGGRR